MKEEGVNKESSLVVPVLLSSIVGAGVALLLTPKAGKEMRSDLKRYATRASGKAAEAADTVAELSQSGAGIAVGAAEAVQQQYGAGTESLEEMTNGESSKFSLVAPILISGVIGAGIALLFAPKSGNELVDDIKRIARSAADSIGTAIEKGQSVYQEAAASAKEAVEKAYTEGKEKLKEAA